MTSPATTPLTRDCGKCRYCDPAPSDITHFHRWASRQCGRPVPAPTSEVLTGTAPEDIPTPEYYPLLTEAAVVAGANQLRSQLGDFTSPDVLMRKRAKFVLVAALPYLVAQPVR